MTWRDFFERYGVVVAVTAILTLVLALLPGNAQDRLVGEGTASDGLVAGGPLDGSGATFDDTTTFDPGTGTIGGQTGLPGRSSDGTTADPALGGSSSEASSLVFGEGPHCSAEGRQKGVSRSHPPCALWRGTDNGGATARGVTKDAIKVVRWLGQVDAGTQAFLEGAKLADSREIRRRSYDAFRIYFNQHYETYGREVQMVDYNASGPGDNDAAMRKDAIEIAQNIKAFAVIVGTPDAQIPGVLAKELAARGVICLCTVSGRSQWYTAQKPYIFSSLPTITEYNTQVAEYVGKRLNGRKAKFAGDELQPNPAERMRDKQRVFGLVYIEGAGGRVEPEATKAANELEAELARYGVSLKGRKFAYQYDPGRNQQDVTTLIATLRSEGVTTIILYVDPVYPIFITQEATRQQYYPEWIQAGTGLSDTTAAGRLYDQAQWRHSFGISPLWVTWKTLERSPAYRAFYHARPDIQPGSCGKDPCEGVLHAIYFSYWNTFFRGVHLAGPILTADTFAAGQFSYPPTGGTPAAPLVFLTREFPTEIKDFTEIFYKYDEQGRDERGEEGLGMVMKVDFGRRYRPGEWPNTEPKVFDPENAVAVSDNPPGGGEPAHVQDGHSHSGKCLSCSS